MATCSPCTSLNKETVQLFLLSSFHSDLSVYLLLICPQLSLECWRTMATSALLTVMYRVTVTDRSTATKEMVRGLAPVGNLRDLHSV